MNAFGSGNTHDRRNQLSGHMLEAYLPYRLMVIAHRVTQATAKIYREKHQLSVTEWRIISTLGQYPGSSVRDVCRITWMKRAKISRVTAGLIDRGLVSKCSDRSDKRLIELFLSDAGFRILMDVVPQGLRWEEKLLEQFSTEEKVALEQAIYQLENALDTMAG